MSTERVLYLYSYLKNRKVLNGNFPVVVEGYINCQAPQGLTPAEKTHILSEAPDLNFLIQSQYLTSFNNEGLTTNDGNILIYF
jgi:hypothetical protein